jgi:hypothetical protein
MMTTEMVNWVKTLKTGDVVALSRATNYGDQMWLAQIDKITPTGMIKVGKYTFNPDGSPRGQNDSYHRVYLASDEDYEKWDLKTRAKRRRNEVISKLINTTWSNHSTTKLERILAVLESEIDE